MVRLVNLHKSFGPLRVLAGIDLELKRGETTVVMGPSGTGKSVLLKHVVGLIRPDRGEVWFEGKRIDTLDEPDLVEVRKKIGFLFQMGALFDSMSVEENITFPLAEHTAMSKRERADRCEAALKMVGLSGVQKKMPAELSGGQKKRVALARAVVLEPDMILYDEPTTGLDPIRSDVINELIISLSKNLGITSLVVTHDMISANKVADRMVMLYDGKVIADGTPDEFRHSDNDTVQRFIKGEADAEDLEQIHAGFAATAQANGANAASAKGKNGDQS
jgi:phospholipid/cholesterol/gamma-HCH transport system ATP-binding protein